MSGDAASNRSVAVTDHERLGDVSQSRNHDLADCLQVYDSKDGEMSEWLKEHAWKTIVVTLAKRY